MFVILPTDRSQPWLRHQHVTRRRRAFTWRRLLLWLGGELLALGAAIVLLRVLAAAVSR